MQSKRSLLLAVFISFLSPSTSQAITTTDSVPQGVRASAFVFGFANDLDSNFNSKGHLESLVAPLNRSITMADLRGASSDLDLLVKALNTLGPENLGDNLFLANLYAKTRIYEKRYAAAFLYGLTDEWSLGVNFPFIDRRVESSFSVNLESQEKKIRELVGSLPQFKEGMQKLAEQNIDESYMTQKIFLERGYKIPEGYSAEGVGDIEIESRYLYYRSDLLRLGLRGRLKLPTATYRPDIHNLVDRPLGDGSASFRLGSLHDLRVFPGILTLTSAAFLTFAAPAHPMLAGKKSEDEILPNLNDPSQIGRVSFQRAPRFDLDTGVMADIWQGVLSFSMSYLYTAQGSNQIRGSKSLSYAFLEKNSASKSHGIEAGIEFSTIPLFKKRVVDAPAKLSFSWYQPLRGQNTLYSPYGRLDVVMLF